MSFTVRFGDNFALKQDAGADVVFEASGDDRTISGSTDDYGSLAQSTLTTSPVALLVPGTGHDFIVSAMTVSNPGTSTRVVTMYKTKGTTTYDATTRWGPLLTLAPAECAMWCEGAWVVYDALGYPKISSARSVRNYFAPAQAIAVTETYVTNSNILVAALLAGHILRWKVFVTKTGAGTVAPIISVYVGTNGSTADTKRFTTGTLVWTTALPAQTANADQMCLEVEVQCVGAGATGTLFGHLRAIRQNTALLGFSVNPNVQQHGLTAAIDISAANIQLGLAFTSGTSAAWTINQVLTEVLTP